MPFINHFFYSNPISIEVENAIAELQRWVKIIIFFFSFLFVVCSVADSISNLIEDAMNLFPYQLKYLGFLD